MIFSCHKNHVRRGLAVSSTFCLYKWFSQIIHFQVTILWCIRIQLCTQPCSQRVPKSNNNNPYTTEDQNRDSRAIHFLNSFFVFLWKMSDYFFYFAYYYLYYLLITQSLFMSTILPTAMYLENKYVLFAEIKKGHFFLLRPWSFMLIIRIWDICSDHLLLLHSDDIIRM